jgi:hypothetical protein
VTKTHSGATEFIWYALFCYLGVACCVIVLVLQEKKTYQQWGNKIFGDTKINMQYLQSGSTPSLGDWQPPPLFVFALLFLHFYRYPTARHRVQITIKV